MAGHDIVVMGASAGGIPPIQRVLSALPAGFPASILISLHVSPEGPGLLPEILRRLSSMPVGYARDRQRLEKGRIYVAPPDRHLLLDEGMLRVTAGPRENRHRPAIDPLFRSAARTADSRVIAVLFSGLLDDGTAGLQAVTRAGGISIVQDPEEARFASMPRNALEKDSPKYVLPATEIAATLIRLVRKPAGKKTKGNTPGQPSKKSKLAELIVPVRGRDEPGSASVYVCPECNGTLFEIKHGEMTRFRCRVGHAYGTESLLQAKHEELEAALWTAMRTLEEKADLYHRIGERAQRRRNSEVSRRFRQNAQDMRTQAQIIRDLLVEPEETPISTGTEG